MPIDPELRRWMKKVDSKLDNIEYRLGNVEHRLDEVDSRLDDMEYRLDDIEYRLGKIDFRLDKLDIATNKINIRLDELTLYISSLESSLEDGLDNMQSEIFGLQGSIDELRPLIYSASRRVAVLEKNGGDTCLSDCNKPSPKQGVHGNHKYNINDGSINKHDDWFG